MQGEWTQERPVLPGFWWCRCEGVHGSSETDRVLIYRHADDGCLWGTWGNIEHRADSVHGAWWLRAEGNEVPDPPPAAQPAWERVIRQHSDGFQLIIGGDELIEAIRAEERKESKP